MDAETLLDVLAALPGVHIAEKGTRRAYGGWPKVEVTLALDPREPTPPEFTVRIGETAKPEPTPTNVTLERPHVPATAESAFVELCKVLALPDYASWDDVIYYAAKGRGSVRTSVETVKRRSAQLAETLGVVGDTPPTWPVLLAEVRKLVAQAGEAVRTQ
jgi:hypothetical protein